LAKSKRHGAKSTHFIVEVRSGNLVVSLPNGRFKATYYKPAGRPHLILRERCCYWLATCSKAFRVRDQIGCSWNASLQITFNDRRLVQRKGETSMKSLVTILAVAIAVAFTVPAFAGPGSTITNKEDCEKAGKVWDDASKKCVEKQ
jgi:hypothetical protein